MRKLHSMHTSSIYIAHRQIIMTLIMKKYNVDHIRLHAAYLTFCIHVHTQQCLTSGHTIALLVAVMDKAVCSHWTRGNQALRPQIWKWLHSPIATNLATDVQLCTRYIKRNQHLKAILAAINTISIPPSRTPKAEVLWPTCTGNRTWLLHSTSIFHIRRNGFRNIQENCISSIYQARATLRRKHSLDKFLSPALFNHMHDHHRGEHSESVQLIWLLQMPRFPQFLFNTFIAFFLCTHFCVICIYFYYLKTSLTFIVGYDSSKAIDLCTVTQCKKLVIRYSIFLRIHIWGSPNIRLSSIFEYTCKMANPQVHDESIKSFHGFPIRRRCAAAATNTKKSEYNSAAGW